MQFHSSSGYNVLWFIQIDTSKFKQQNSVSFDSKFTRLKINFSFACINTNWMTLFLPLFRQKKIIQKGKNKILAFFSSATIARFENKQIVYKKLQIFFHTKLILLLLTHLNKENLLK